MKIIKFRKKPNNKDVLIQQMDFLIKDIFEQHLKKLDYETCFGTSLLLNFRYLEQMMECLPKNKKEELKQKMIDLCMTSLSRIEDL